jgi:hypothetical protein
VEWNWKLTTERKMIILCSDDEFVAAIGWFNDRSSSSSRQTDRRKEKGEILDHNTPPILVLFSSSPLSLSLSLSSPPETQEKQEKKKKVKVWSCKWSTPHKSKTTKSKKNLC